MSAVMADAAANHTRLGHPVIDGDGHLLEPTAVLHDFLSELVGGRSARRILLYAGRHATAREGSMLQPKTGSWLIPSRAEDVATAMAPALRAARAKELGIDFHVVYPSIGLVLATLPDDGFRLPAVRAVNAMNAEICRDYAGCLTPAAVIPMHTPHEAVAELTHAAGLGFKVAVIPPLVARPVHALESAFPRLCWLDSYGIDSAYDYDPVWATFAELGLAVTAHGGVTACLPFGWDSPSNYVFNHIGAHSFQQEHLCKSLILGGVPVRFPTLNFAFLECGALWACGMLQALVEHHAKRGPAGIADLDPAHTDRAELARLLQRYGGAGFVSSIPFASGRRPAEAADRDGRQDFDRTQAASAKDLIQAFDRFYFGCEADDRGAVVALQSAHLFGTRIRAVFGSDIGHWDVPSAAGVMAECYELVESAGLDRPSYRDFVFRHSVLLHGQMNADFFAGTAVEDSAREVLRAGAATPIGGAYSGTQPDAPRPFAPSTQVSDGFVA